MEGRAFPTLRETDAPPGQNARRAPDALSNPAATVKQSNGSMRGEKTLETSVTPF